MIPNLHPHVMELIVSRVCHDLANPIGAVHNGMELIEEMGLDAGDEALDLVTTSVDQVSYRLQLYRFAYGAAGSAESFPSSNMAVSFKNWVKQTRTEFEWPDYGLMGDYPRGFLKVLLNYLILAHESCPVGGKITVTEEDGERVVIRTTGERIVLPDSAEQNLHGQCDPQSLTPKSVHSYICHVFAKHFGIHAKVDFDRDDGLVFTLSA